jgi:molybdate-binding protein
MAAGMHLFDVTADDWNVPAVRDRLGGDAVVLVEWCWRERGLIVAPDKAGGLTRIADLAGHRIVPRQPEAGTQVLLEHLLTAERMLPGRDFTFTHPARSEADAALAVLDGKADATFGLETLARQYRLAFAPVVRERFDLLVDRRSWFEPPWQTVIAFGGSPAFHEKAVEFAGYDVGGLGRVHFNGP